MLQLTTKAMIAQQSFALTGVGSSPLTNCEVSLAKDFLAAPSKDLLLGQIVEADFAGYTSGQAISITDPVALRSNGSVGVQADALLWGPTETGSQAIKGYFLRSTVTSGGLIPGDLVGAEQWEVPVNVSDQVLRVGVVLSVDPSIGWGFAVVSG